MKREKSVDSLDRLDTKHKVQRPDQATEEGFQGRTANGPKESLPNEHKSNSREKLKELPTVDGCCWRRD